MCSGLIRPPGRCGWWPTISTGPTGWRSRPTSASFTSWTAGASNATNATYTVYDGTQASGTVLGSVVVSQSTAPAGTNFEGFQFQELGVFFPTVIATFSGIDAVPRGLIRMAQSFGMPMPAIVAKIVLPGALPSIIAGARVSAATALLLVVAAEMIGAQEGIGAFINTAGNLMQTDQLMAGVVVLALLGLVVGGLLSALERRLLRWR